MRGGIKCEMPRAWCNVYGKGGVMHLISRRADREE